MDPTELVLTAEQRDLARRLDEVAQARMAARAAQLDADFAEPREDMEDLRNEGWLLATLAERYGGLGFGVDGGEPLSFFLMIEHLARVNPSTAHCFQVHNNTLQMISVLATNEQRERWIEPTRARGALLVGAGSEPGGAIRTVAIPANGGYRLRGSKYFATNASMAEWLAVAACVGESPEVALFVVHRDTPGLQIDASGWRPTGMRACVSPTLLLEDCEVAGDAMLGAPGEYRAGHWQSKFHPAFASNYLGSAEGMFHWMVDYLRKKGAGADPFRQAEVGELKMLIDAARLMLYQSANTYRVDFDRAVLLSMEAKALTQRLLARVTELGGDIVGSSAFFLSHPLERFYRDTLVHATHSRQIVSLQTVGAAALGQEYDVERQR